MSNYEVVTFPLVSWVRCGALLYLIPDCCPLFYFSFPELSCIGLFEVMLFIPVNNDCTPYSLCVCGIVKAILHWYV